MNRRGFLQGILAAGVAPYVSTAAEVLMPVKQIVSPPVVGLDDAFLKAFEENLRYTWHQYRPDFILCGAATWRMINGIAVRA